MIYLQQQGFKALAIALVLTAAATAASAQTCAPEARFVYVSSEGESTEETTDNFAGSAPVEATFTANATDYDGYSVRYEWRIFQSDDTTNVLVHRFDEQIEYTFVKNGTFTVELKATFQSDNDLVEYSSSEEGTSITVTIYESRLEMPNAFSPGDDDDYNRIYKAKSNHQSIVKFHATIFNRWGQKLYSWDDVNGGWDGKVNGRVVRNGVYFVNVTAQGADGRTYHIRKDVNVLTKYTQEQNSTSGTE